MPQALVGFGPPLLEDILGQTHGSCEDILCGGSQSTICNWIQTEGQSAVTAKGDSQMCLGVMELNQWAL